MKEKIYKFICERKEVTFVELERFFEGNGIDYKGDFAIGTSTGVPVYMWFGWKEEIAKILAQLRSEKKITFFPATVFIYLVDGKVPSVPIYKGRRVKKDHWLPALVCTKEHADKLERQILKNQK